MRPGTFTADFDDDTRVLTLSGELDEAAATVLRDTLTSHTDDYSKSLVIDLSSVDYLPSAAVGVLARAQQQAAGSGQSLDLVASDGTIAQRVLVVCGLPHRTS